MKIPISSPNQPVLNKANLDRVKVHILAAGQRCTYVNMYNNNPCWELADFRLYLNPDPGPDGHPQWNLNCDASRGDFNTLVVQRKRGDSGHILIAFQPENPVLLRVPASATPSEIRAIEEDLAAAVLASLEAIKRGHQIPKAR